MRFAQDLSVTAVVEDAVAAGADEQSNDNKDNPEEDGTAEHGDDAGDHEDGGDDP